MQSIEIRKGVKVPLPELVNSVSRLETPVLTNFMEQMNQVLNFRLANTSLSKEAQLLKEIREIIPASVVRRFRQLRSKHRQGSATERELEEMAMLTDFMETKSAERVRLLADLAEIRKVSLRELAKQLRLSNFYA